MSAEPMLEVRGLRAGYHRTVVLRGINLSIDAGRSVGLGGLNGSGKSTLLGALSGTVEHTAERLILAGRPLPSSSHKRAAAGLAHVPEGRRVFADLTVEDNLTFGAVAGGRTSREVRTSREEILETFPELRPLLDRRAGQLSGGEQQMLSIGRGLMAQPKLLMVDELSLGLSPKAAEQISAGLNDIRSRRGTTLLLVDQNLTLLAASCDELYILSDGVLLLEETGPSAASMAYF